jgi:L-lactate dehydrogenase (cytochrome)
MQDRAAVKTAPTGWGVSGNSREAKLRRRFPTVEDLRKASERRIPSLGYETVAGGNGQNLGVKRNADALDAIEMVPRTGADKGPVATDVTLFGRHYAAPLGIAPMGLQSVFWPGAERHLARAAQRARIPYTAGTVSGIALEEAAKLAPDVIWFQLYRLARDDHKVGFDLVRRAQAAGVHVLVMTVDTPGRAKRPGELRNGLTLPFRPTLRTIMQAALSPAWMRALLQNGQPSFPCLAPYCGENARNSDIAWFAQSEVGGAFSFEELKRYRDVWKGPMVIKGVMHPADAEKAISIGLDGVQVSNHGGRQLEAAPAAIDVLPAVVRAVGNKATVLFDSGVRSGLDAVRAVALGAQAALAGRAFLYGVGAAGADGADYVTDMLVEEISVAMRQLGTPDIAALRALSIRHPGAWQF